MKNLKKRLFVRVCEDLKFAGSKIYTLVQANIGVNIRIKKSDAHYYQLSFYTSSQGSNYNKARALRTHVNNKTFTTRTSMQITVLARYICIRVFTQISAVWLRDAAVVRDSCYEYPVSEV